jgi:sugar/nucleoside kinase (ribokinase family)
MRFNIPFPKNTPFDVVGMGLNSIDFLSLVSEYPASNSKTEILRFARSGGGQVATAMVALSRWGVKTKYIGKVGDDELGQLSLESIRQEGVDVSSVTIEPDTPTQLGNIIVEAVSGDRTILWRRDNRLMYREGELLQKDICAGRLLHLDGHDIRAAIQSARWAREAGITTVVDIDKVEPLTSELIRGIDFVVTSSRFPTLFTGIPDREKALFELQKYTPGFLCTTLGSEGAMALVDGKVLFIEGIKVDVVDTTGAGDVFHAGFIYGLLQNWEVAKILRFANAVAGLKCRDLGGRRAIPTLDEVRNFLDPPMVP